MSRFLIERSFVLDDFDVKGRTVTAYAVPFDSPAVVVDPQFSPARHLESVSRSAFTRALNAGAGLKAKVLFNHGKTNDGTTSERYSMPIGTPLDVRAEPKGLLTVTRYAQTDLADEVLELIRNESLTAQSFRGPVYNHTNRAGLIELTECGLREYGPVTFPAYAGAEIVSIRSASDLLDAAAELTPEQRAELAKLLTEHPDTPIEGPADTPAEGTVDGTPDEDPSTVTPEPEGDIDLLALANERRHII